MTLASIALIILGAVLILFADNQATTILGIIVLTAGVAAAIFRR